MSDSIIKVEHVSKSFRLPHEKYTGLKQAIINLPKGKSYDEQKVLKDVSFTINRGEFFGIVGRNGSGKSTLLKLLAQIYVADKGGIHINGSLTALIELGVGFNPELTGRENVYLNGALLGFDRKQMNALYDDIVDFAELHEFMDQKLKNYSSGMQVRLAFSVAIRAKTDILLVDEVLAVGDAAFQTKCFDYFYELKRSGATVIFVSHDRTSLERFCDRGVLIDKGEVVIEGPITKVLQSYSKVVLEELAGHDGPAGTRSAITSPYVSITDVSACNATGKAHDTFSFGDDVFITYQIKIERDITNPVFGVTVWQRNLDKAVFATNTIVDGSKPTGQFSAGQVVTFTVKMPAFINDGEFHIEPAIANESATVFLEQQPMAATFYISGSNNPHSILDAPEKISLTTV